MSDIRERFDAAVARSTSLPSQSNTTKLDLYALFKQATKGDAQGKRPGRLDPVGRAKYDAWAKLSGLSSEDAMGRYAALVDSLARG